MSFRKRNDVLSRTPEFRQTPIRSAVQPKISVATTTPPGTRHSPVDGRLTTSTGTYSLDNVLAGHAGLVLGNLVLLGESGTTDYAGTLLRCFAAEGIVQGHAIHVVGVGEQWARELPGLVGPAGVESSLEDGIKREKERMKIAWRYEALGDFAKQSGTRSHAAVERGPEAGKATTHDKDTAAFCHIFDLAKRLDIPADASINSILVSPMIGPNPFQNILKTITARLQNSPPNRVHRLIIPTILSPAIYPYNSSSPHLILGFLHSLRQLLRQYSFQLVVFISLPLSLFPRSTGLVRWIETLSDGVIELTPFPHLLGPGTTGTLSTSGASTVHEDQPQGMVKIHKLPVFHERGGGGNVTGLGDDLTFTVSRRKFVIRPFNLPPTEGDAEAQQGQVDSTKAQMEF